jgi:hypothetical protein
VEGSIACICKIIRRYGICLSSEAAAGVIGWHTSNPSPRIVV